jgi:hypothetical protein
MGDGGLISFVSFPYSRSVIVIPPVKSVPNFPEFLRPTVCLLTDGGEFDIVYAEITEKRKGADYDF